MRFKSRYILLLVILLILSITNVGAQTPFLKKIPLFQGKEDYTVNVVFQDPFGWIWFGTDKGLFRYDGINLDLYTLSDSLADNNITAIAADKHGIIWIGHKNGKISVYKKNAFSKFRPEGGLGKVEISDIVIDSAGVLWYSTKGEGIFRYDGRYLSNMNTDDGLSDDYVYDIELDARGVLWIASDYGLTEVSADTTRIISMKDGLPDNIVRVVKAGPDGKIWLGADEAGISVFDPENSSITEIGAWEFGPITGFAMNLENVLWVSTASQGIVKLNIEDYANKPGYQQIRSDQGLISDRLSTILKDTENNIWVAGRKGVVQALPPVFEFLNKNNGAPFDMVYSFCIDLDGAYWACTEGGLYKGVSDEYASLGWYNISDDLGLSNLSFISVYMSPDGYIWAGTYGSGVFKISSSGDQYRNYNLKDGLLDNNVISISGNDSLVLFSTLGGGVSGYDLSLNKVINFNNEVLNQSYVYSSVIDDSGKAWVAGLMDSPAYIYQNKVHFLDSDQYDFPQLYGIALDSAGHAWFNTNEDGILCVTPDSIIAFGPEQGVDLKGIQSIVFDKNNNLILISNLGIDFYNQRKGMVMRFGENTGLAYRYPILNSVYTDRKDQIWIGTETGIIKYNPDYLDIVNTVPHIFLSTINLFGKPISRTDTEFRYNENNFTFAYTGIWFRNPEGLTYRYKLDGYDLDWTYSKRNQPFTYSKLQAGEYTFIAEVSLDENKWVSSEEGSFSFTVMPPFWERWWFIVTILILIIFSVYGYIRKRLSNLKRAKEELEKEVAIRTEEIRAKNEVLQSQKEEIATQRDNAEEQRDQIEHQNEEIQASIRYAYRIQTAALPPKSYLKEILGEYFILNKPRDVVSGDFYWAAKRDEHIFFAVADCTGHGVPGAFMSMLGLSALNDIVKSLEICKASQVVDLLSERIKESLHQSFGGESTSKDGMDISLCIYEPSTSILQFAGAYNNLYMIKNGNCEIIPADKMGIGSDEKENFSYTNHTFTLEKNDIVYLFSDGFPDQFGGPNAKKYKYKPFREFLLKIYKESMTFQKWMLDEEIEAWMLGYPQIDDILVMGVKKS